MSSPSQLPRLVTVRAAGAVTSSDSFPVGAEEELYTKLFARATGDNK